MKKSGAPDSAGLDRGERPSTVTRRCTDCLYSIFFILALGALLGITIYASQNGKIGRAAGLPDWRGQICGVSSSVVDKPYLYVCVDPTQTTVAASFGGVCVSSCPARAAAAGSSSQCVAINSSPDYPTKPFGGVLCMPTDTSLIANVMKTTAAGPASGWLETVAALQAWQPVAISAACAVLLAFLYYYFIQHCASCLFWIGVTGFISVSSAAGGYLLFVSQRGGSDGLPSTGDSQQDLIAGTALLLASAVMALVVWCKRGSLELATESIKAAAECVRDMPFLLLEPGFSLSVKATALVCWLAGFLLLLTCVKRAEFNREIVLEYDPLVQCFIVFYLFMGFWIMEFCTVLSQFVIAFATEEWYFASYDKAAKAKPVPLLAPLRAYAVGLTYHFGSLAHGSFVLAMASAAQTAMSLVATASKESGNPAAECLAKVCACCLSCFEAMLRAVSRAALMDVAMNANAFCAAARHSTSVLLHEATAVASLRGAAWLLELTGLAAISAAGAGLTYLMCKTWPQFADQASPQYVREPVFLAAASALVCFLVSVPFMLVFDFMADTVLFCIALDRQRNPVKFHLQVLESEMVHSCMPFLSLHGSHEPQTERAFHNDHPPETLALIKKAVS